MRGTNTYVIGKGHERILIDTGEGKASWSRQLDSVLSSEGATVSQVLLTHWHPDHVGGVGDVLALCKDAFIHKHHPAAGQSAIENGQIFRAEGATLRALHCPGHTADHMAFILEEEDAMFMGDNVLGHGTAVFEDLVVYLQSLELMSHQFSGRGYPAHGALIPNGRERVQEYITHRQQREEEILQILRRPHASSSSISNELSTEPVAPAAATATALAPSELVKIIYNDIPPTLHPAAKKGILQMLHKLSHEGKVVAILSSDSSSDTDYEEEKWQLAHKAGL